MQRHSFYEMRQSSQLVHAKPTEFASRFDYVMIFKMEGDHNKEQSITAKHCIRSMVEADLEVYTYLSVQEDELIVLITCGTKKLEDFADKVDFNMLMDPAALEEKMLAGDPEKRIAPVNIRHDVNITPLTPFEFIYGKYDGDVEKKLYHTPPGESSPFTKNVRLKLIAQMLKAPKRLGGCDLEISKLIIKKKILAMYPLHDRSITEQLLERCLDKWSYPWSVPVHDLKEYFGEKLVLYDVFIGHYSTWLVIPSIIGLAFQLVVWSTLNFSSPVLPFFSVVITVWSIIMLEFWKREEAWTALRWGMTDYEKKELDRPEFVGDLINSYIDGQDMLYFPPDSIQSRIAMSMSVVVTFICVVIGVVAGIYYMRFTLQPQIGTASSAVASFLNTAQILVFNIIYQYIAVRLTNNENHRTDTQYEDSMIVKVFIFQFINSYSSFFFLAFIAQWLTKPDEADDSEQGQCGADNCMQPLAINLAIIFGSRLTFGNLLDVAVPYVLHKLKIRKETKGITEDKKLSPPELDYMLMEYDSMQESIKSYADTAVQYGFTLLFITALPIACALSLFNNYVRVKVRMWKLFTFYQRPIPNGVEDIGQWQSIFTIISVIAVVTNGALISFTMRNGLQSNSASWGRVWVFVGFQWTLIAVQFIASIYVDDTPEEVEIQESRMDFIRSKIIDKAEDDDYNVEFETVVEEDDEDASGMEKGCCGRTKLKKKGKAKKMDPSHSKNVPVASYPFTSMPDQWPDLIMKENIDAYHGYGASSAVAAKKAAYSDHVSAVSAVPRPPEPTN